MFWCDKIAERLSAGEPQIINDSKTPSGRVHVGALRGVLIHDALFRTLKARGIPCRYLFGVDDYDPVDELPNGMEDHYRPYLGVPLCNAPPPPGSPHSDMAEHYIAEFFEIFRELGVDTEHYRMREIYRSGRFDSAIDVILSANDVVRQIYRDVSKSERPEHWHPFQVICEKCGKIGTTQVHSYDGKEVEYRCSPDLVTWATGCGYAGKMSPFGGNGKLPWKLEWVAKWREFPVTIEGAGKDHATKGGSRDVAATCLRKIFAKQPPINVPYEFFLIGGAKMSSSKGLGATARSIANLLPPTILRFLMLRTLPNRPVNFAAEENTIIKVFNDYDRFHTRYFHDDTMSSDDRRVYELSQRDAATDLYEANFQLVLTLVQMPHLDLVEQLQNQKGSPLSETERDHLRKRIEAAEYWLDNFATEEERTQLQDDLPDSARAFSAVQKAFLHVAADLLEEAPWTSDAIQMKLFDAARCTPIRQSAAFQTIYTVLLDRNSGPKAGNLIAFLDRQFVLSRFRELNYSRSEFVLQSATSEEEFCSWLEKQKETIASLAACECLLAAEAGQETKQVGAVEFDIQTREGKVSRQRVLLGANTETESEWSNPGEFARSVDRYLEGIEMLFPGPTPGGGRWWTG